MSSSFFLCVCTDLLISVMRIFIYCCTLHIRHTDFPHLLFCFVRRNFRTEPKFPCDMTPIKSWARLPRDRHLMGHCYEIYMKPEQPLISSSHVFIIPHQLHSQIPERGPVGIAGRNRRKRLAAEAHLVAPGAGSVAPLIQPAMRPPRPRAPLAFLIRLRRWRDHRPPSRCRLPPKMV